MRYYYLLRVKSCEKKPNDLMSFYKVGNFMIFIYLCTILLNGKTMHYLIDGLDKICFVKKSICLGFA